ncbi:MAG: S53 family peptidase [Armatimonadetes bacterium]|nr:S53 family peptidase [Armatimonadota bacterium]
MRLSRKLFFGSAALAAVFVLDGCGGSGSSVNGVADAQKLGNGSLTTAATISAPGHMGYNGDSSVFVPASTSQNVKGFAHTNTYIKLNTGDIGQNSVVYTPAQIKKAYMLSTPAAGQGVIVIVDAFHDPFALADFNYFSTQFGLPTEPSNNVLANSNTVFQIIYETGTQPAYNAGWSQEEALDIEWAHAMAPAAKIILLEAADNSYTHLLNADVMAAGIANAHQCSNSWGGGEFNGEQSFDSTFTAPNMVYFFSGGDSGGVREYPSTSPNVVAVGGTSLFLDGNNNRSSEIAWSGTGCGPSAFEPRPAFQNRVAYKVGAARGADDISAVADPATGVYVRWNGGWYAFGGTSVACPIIAGITNRANTNRGNSQQQNAQFYSRLGSTAFFDCAGGNAGGFAGVLGYDFPTGVGTPNGMGGF